jgi:dTDP-4-amino-4,6-dideoxygalactose transaminase
VIPRLRPWIGAPELRAILGAASCGIQEFEEAFAGAFGTREAVSFGYGRTGMYLLLRSLGWTQREIVLPAYTCVVVSHAIVKTGNIPVFVDCRLDDYNMDLGRLEEALTPQTAMVVATHLYGFPQDPEQIEEIVRRRAPRAIVLHDCAHSFGAEVRGRSVMAAGAASLVGMNISKIMSSIFGGMIATSDPELASRLRRQRDQECRAARPGRDLRRRLYLLAAAAAFTTPFLELVDVLEQRTPLLRRYTEYYRDDIIDMPGDFLEQMGTLEAAVGLAQLRKYPRIIARRRQLARLYHELLPQSPHYVKPPAPEGATYSHYPIRVEHREHVLDKLHRRGVQGGRVIEYSIPEMPAYRTYRRTDYPNAKYCSEHMINLPIHPQMTLEGVRNTCRALANLFA